MAVPWRDVYMYTHTHTHLYIVASTVCVMHAYTCVRIYNWHTVHTRHDSLPRSYARSRGCRIISKSCSLNGNVVVVVVATSLACCDIYTHGRYVYMYNRRTEQSPTIRACVRARESGRHTRNGSQRPQYHSVRVYVCVQRRSKFELDTCRDRLSGICRAATRTDWLDRGLSLG